MIAGGQLSFMHPETFEQISLSPGVIGMQRSLLKEGSYVTLNLLHGEVLSGKPWFSHVVHLHNAKCSRLRADAYEAFKTEHQAMSPFNLKFRCMACVLFDT